MFKILKEIEYKGIICTHYMDGKKFMVSMMIKRPELKKFDFISIYQVRAIKEPLTETDLKIHVDKILEEIKQRKAKETDND